MLGTKRYHLLPLSPMTHGDLTEGCEGEELALAPVGRRAFRVPHVRVTAGGSLGT